MSSLVATTNETLVVEINDEGIAQEEDQEWVVSATLVERLEDGSTTTAVSPTVFANFRRLLAPPNSHDEDPDVNYLGNHQSGHVSEYQAKSLSSPIRAYGIGTEPFLATAYQAPDLPDSVLGLNLVMQRASPTTGDASGSVVTTTTTKFFPIQFLLQYHLGPSYHDDHNQKNQKANAEQLDFWTPDLQLLVLHETRLHSDFVARNGHVFVQNELQVGELDTVLAWDAAWNPIQNATIYRLDNAGQLLSPAVYSQHAWHESNRYQQHLYLFRASSSATALPSLVPLGGTALAKFSTSLNQPTASSQSSSSSNSGNNKKKHGKSNQADVQNQDDETVKIQTFQSDTVVQFKYYQGISHYGILAGKPFVGRVLVPQELTGQDALLFADAVTWLSSAGDLRYPDSVLLLVEALIQFRLRLPSSDDSNLEAESFDAVDAQFLVGAPSSAGGDKAAFVLDEAYLRHHAHLLLLPKLNEGEATTVALKGIRTPWVNVTLYRLGTTGPLGTPAANNMGEDRTSNGLFSLLKWPQKSGTGNALPEINKHLWWGLLGTVVAFGLVVCVFRCCGLPRRRRTATHKEDHTPLTGGEGLYRDEILTEEEMEERGIARRNEFSSEEQDAVDMRWDDDRSHDDDDD